MSDGSAVITVWHALTEKIGLVSKSIVGTWQKISALMDWFSKEQRGSVDNDILELVQQFAGQQDEPFDPRPAS